MSTVNEMWFACKGDSTLTDDNKGQYLAVKISDTARGLGDEPEVALTDTAQDEVFGQYMSRESDGTCRIATCGVLYLRATAAYAATQNGFGVLATTTDGQVAVAGTIGLGVGRIIGGGTATVGGATVNILKVYVPAS